MVEAGQQAQDKPKSRWWSASKHPGWQPKASLLIFAFPYIAMLHFPALQCILPAICIVHLISLHYPTLHLILRAQVWYLYWVVVSIAVQCIVGCNAMRCHCLASNAMRGTQRIFPFLSQGSAQLPDWRQCPDSLHPSCPPPQLIVSYICMRALSLVLGKFVPRQKPFFVCLEIKSLSPHWDGCLNDYVESRFVACHILNEQDIS